MDSPVRIGFPHPPPFMDREIPIETDSILKAPVDISIENNFRTLVGGYSLLCLLHSGYKESCKSISFIVIT